MKRNKDIKKNNFNITSKQIKILLSFSLFLLIFSLLAPLIFTQFSIIDFSNSGPIGDTIGGIMNPFIAIIGILLTFLAFYIQYEANNKQVTNFKQDFDAQNERFEKSQFESQFYEMLRLHKENINEMRIVGWSFITKEDKANPTKHINGDGITETANYIHSKVDKVTEGRKVFVTMFTELEASFKITKLYLEYEFSDITIPDSLIIIFAYRVVFFGIESEFLITDKLLPYSVQFEKCRIELKKIRDEISNSDEPMKKIELDYLHYYNSIGIDDKEQEKLTVKLYINYKAFSGHISRLGHYYRHLYHLVSFVANNKSKSIKLKDKKFYLKIVRGQMSNHEQLMLYYNFIAGLGHDWESNEKKKNKFFTKFRMIHNLPTKQATFGVSAVEYFKDDIERKKDTKEPMFEWEE